MPTYEVQSPDGTKYRVNAPEGATEQDAIAYVQKNFNQEGSPKYDRSAFDNGPLKIGKEGFADSLKQTLDEAGWANRNIAGAGTALSNLWEGGKQLFGQGNAENIANNKIIEDAAPIGSFVGNAALTAIPFAAAGTGLKAAGAVGAGIGAMQPVSGEQTLENVVRGKLLNTAIGGATGVAGQAVANKASSIISDKLARLQALKTQRAPIDATIKEAIDAGYVIPPGNVNPTFKNRVMESIGGKIATQQMAAERNQATTDRLARSAAGLMTDEPITPASLGAVRKQLGTAYDDVGNIVGQDTVETLKTLRADANDLWKMQARNPHPETLALARQKTADAANLENTIDQVLTSVGKTDTMSAFREARKKIAINHAVENAFVEGGGTIDARTISRATQRGDVQSGELATIGNFANNFPKITQPDKMIGTPDAHNLKYVSSLLLGGGGMAAGGPFGIVAGALPILSGPLVRRGMFSKSAQQGLLSDYTLGAIPRATGGLLKYTPGVSTALGFEALP